MRNITCILCGLDNTKEIAKGCDRYINVDNKQFTIVQCRSCELGYLNPQPSLHELSKYYSSEYPPYLNDYNVFKEGLLFRILRNIKRKFFISSNTSDTTTKTSKDMSMKKALDFGCGNGRYLLQLRQQHPNWELYGFDISTNKEILKIGKDVTIITDKIDELLSNFEKGSFDELSLNNVLEHLNEPILTLKDLMHLVKKNGTVRIEVPNLDSIKFKIFGSNFSSLDIPRHLFHFNEKTIKEICRMCGLETVSIEKSGSAKSTVRSLHYALNINGSRIGALSYLIADKITKMIGEKKINDDSLIVYARKI